MSREVSCPIGFVTICLDRNSRTEQFAIDSIVVVIGAGMRCLLLVAVLAAGRGFPEAEYGFLVVDALDDKCQRKEIFIQNRKEESRRGSGENALEIFFQGPVSVSLKPSEIDQEWCSGDGFL